MRTLPTGLGAAALPIQWDPVPVRMIVEGAGQHGRRQGKLKTEPDCRVSPQKATSAALRTEPNADSPRSACCGAAGKPRDGVCVDLPWDSGTWSRRGAWAPSRRGLSGSKRSARSLLLDPRRRRRRPPRHATSRPRRAWRPCQANHAPVSQGGLYRSPGPDPADRSCVEIAAACLTQLGRSITDTCQIRLAPGWLELLRRPTRSVISAVAACRGLRWAMHCQLAVPFRRVAGIRPHFVLLQMHFQNPAGAAMGVDCGKEARDAPKKQRQTRPARSLLESFRDLISQRRSKVVKYSSRASFNSETNGR